MPNKKDIIEALSKKKISVKHFLNTKIKDQKTEKHPVYVRVTLDRKKTEFRSFYSYFHPKKLDLLPLSEKEFNNPSDELTIAMWCESLAVYDVVDYFRVLGRNLIDEGDVPRTIIKYSLPLDIAVDGYYQNSILRLLHNKFEDVRGLIDAVDWGRLGFKGLCIILQTNLLQKYSIPEVQALIDEGKEIFKMIKRINERLNKDLFFVGGKFSYLLDRHQFPDGLRIIHWKNQSKKNELTQILLRRKIVGEEELALIDRALKDW